METKPANELLLTTLAERDSRIRTARPRLGRLVALFAGIATVLLLASHQSAKASGLSSFLPEGAGLSISVPLGNHEGAASRPQVQVFAVVGNSDPVRFDLGGSSPRQRLAFAPIATIGGLAGVAAWPSTRLSPPRRPRDRVVVPSQPRHRLAAGAAPGTGIARSAPRQPTIADTARSRRNARLATTSYRRMLRQYLLLPKESSGATASAHARLMRAYHIAQAWRNYAGMR